MRKAARGVALTFGTLCVCLSLALAALAVLGGASAKTAAPPAPGPRAADEQQPVASAVESSATDMPSPARSGGLGSGSVSGTPVLVESDGEEASAEASSAEDAPEEEPQISRTGTSDTEPHSEDTRASSKVTDRSEAGQSGSEDSGSASASGASIGSPESVATGPRPSRPEVPEHKAMKLTIPAMARVESAMVRTAAYDDRAALDAGALHPKGTGFPWEKQANVYIAGHRIGYPATGSFLLFRDLNTLTAGDAVYLTDSMGRKYRYEVYEKEVVDPDSTAVMDEREGENIVTLQTCTLPDYSQRLIVRAHKVDGP